MFFFEKRRGKGEDIREPDLRLNQRNFVINVLLWEEKGKREDFLKKYEEKRVVRYSWTRSALFINFIINVLFLWNRKGKVEDIREPDLRLNQRNFVINVLLWEEKGKRGRFFKKVKEEKGVVRYSWIRSALVAFLERWIPADLDYSIIGIIAISAPPRRRPIVKAPAKMLITHYVLFHWQQCCANLSKNRLLHQSGVTAHSKLLSS